MGTSGGHHGRERIVVGMSGGVDSSVAAALCVEQGFEVIGVFLRNGVAQPPDGPPRCCSAGDAADARGVAARLGAAFYAVDEAEAFQGLIDAFVDDYAAGRTPNPCVTCNRDIKIAALLRMADALGAERVATGHYARHDAGGRRLRRAADRAKDQTYFLTGLDPTQVQRCLFPLGDLDKSAVRDTARRAGLPVADKPESQEICFVAGRSYRELVAERRPDALRRGPIEDVDGTPLGEHDGVAGFTVGQRRGLGLGGGGGVRHVVGVDAERQRVVVGPPGALERHAFRVADVRWWGDQPEDGIRVRVQIRHRHTAVLGDVRPIDGGGAVQLSTSVRGLAPGQIAAFYDPHEDEILLGAGTIVAESPSDERVDASPTSAAAQSTDTSR